jgi:hypothetical protein
MCIENNRPLSHSIGNVPDSLRFRADEFSAAIGRRGRRMEKLEGFRPTGFAGKACLECALRCRDDSTARDSAWKRNGWKISFHWSTPGTQPLGPAAARAAARVLAVSARWKMSVPMSRRYMNLTPAKRFCTRSKHVPTSAASTAACPGRHRPTPPRQSVFPRTLRADKHAFQQIPPSLSDRKPASGHHSCAPQHR